MGRFAPGAAAAEAVAPSRARLAGGAGAPAIITSR
jgi:hypothetical protein